MKQRLTHDRHVLLLVLLSGLPATVVALILVGHTPWTSLSQWTLAGILLAAWMGFAFATRERVIRPLQTLSNLLSALREEDFSVRGRGARTGDPLGEVLIEVNALSDTLKHQRLGARAWCPKTLSPMIGGRTRSAEWRSSRRARPR